MKNQKDLIEQLLIKAKNEASVDAVLNNFKESLLKAYRIRVVEEKLLELFSSAKVSGTVHTCIGQEMTGVAIAAFLNEHDWVTSNHRCHGHYIAKSDDWKGLIDELLGYETGVSKGIGSSQHLYKNNFISNGTQGSLLPVASGVALFNKKNMLPGIAVSFIGEGTLGEGIVYETLNLGAIFQSPHLVICENNYYSQSTPQSAGVSGSIELRAKSFGWEYFETNTWNLEDLFEKCSQAIAFIKKNQTPVFLKIDTYRLKAHSKGDDDRNREEVVQFENLDLLKRAELLEYFSFDFEKIKIEVNDYTDSKINNGNNLEYAGYSSDQLPRKYSIKPEKVTNSNKQLVKALNSAYEKLLINQNTYFVGEDILDPYGGAFKVTKNFSVIRPDQVLSTPISEAGLVGLSIGINLAGGNAIAEIMFGDFIVNAMDQLINNASKFHHMYGKQFDCTVTIRTAMGGGRGYGPTHSQSLEKFLVGIDNVATISITSLVEPEQIIAASAKLRCPKIIIENKIDYGSYLYQPGLDLKLEKIGGEFGTLKLNPINADVSIIIIAHGYLARLIADNYELIFQSCDLVFELICPQLIHPFPIQHLHNSLKISKRIIIAEEGTENFGWAAGIAAQLVQNNPNITIRTVSSDPVPIPSNRQLEKLNLISINKIIKEINILKGQNV
jgi:2-oxoisovalerate dehydrogenase E1 component